MVRPETYARDDQDAEIADLESDITVLETEIEGLEIGLDEANDEIESLRSSRTGWRILSAVLFVLWLIVLVAYMLKA